MCLLSPFGFLGEFHAPVLDDLVEDYVEFLVDFLNLRSCPVQLRVPSNQRLGQVDLVFWHIIIVGLSIYPAGDVESRSMQFSAGTLAPAFAALPVFLHQTAIRMFSGIKDRTFERLALAHKQRGAAFELEQAIHVNTP